MQENKQPVGGVLIHYQIGIKVGCSISCMAAHIHLTIEKSLLKNCKMIIITVDIQFWVAADAVKCFFRSFSVKIVSFRNI